MTMNEETTSTEPCPHCPDTQAYAKRVTPGTFVYCACGTPYAATKAARVRLARDDEHAWEQRARAMRADMHLVARFRGLGASHCGLGAILTGGPPTLEQRKRLGAPDWAKRPSAPSLAPGPLTDAEAEVRDLAAERALARGRELDALVRGLAGTRAGDALAWLVERAGPELEGETKRSLEHHVGMAFASEKQRKAWRAAGDERALASAHGRQLLDATVRVWWAVRERASEGRAA